MKTYIVKKGSFNLSINGVTYFCKLGQNIDLPEIDEHVQVLVYRGYLSTDNIVNPIIG